MANNPLLHAFSSVVMLAFVRGGVRCYEIKCPTSVQLSVIP